MRTSDEDIEDVAVQREGGRVEVSLVLVHCNSNEQDSRERRINKAIDMQIQGMGGLLITLYPQYIERWKKERKNYN